MGLLDIDNKPIVDKWDCPFKDDLPSLESLRRCPNALSNNTLPANEYVARRQWLNNMQTQHRERVQRQKLRQRNFIEEKINEKRLRDKRISTRRLILPIQNIQEPMETTAPVPAEWFNYMEQKHLNSQHRQQHRQKQFEEEVKNDKKKILRRINLYDQTSEDQMETDVPFFVKMVDPSSSSKFY